MRSKTFIYHDGALGDLLLSLPVISAIKRNAERLHMAGNADVISLLKETGYADETSSAGSVLFLSLFTGKIDQRLRDILSQFERVFVFIEKSSAGIADTMKRLIPGITVIQKTPPKGSKMHVSEFRMRQLHGTDSVHTSQIYLEIPRFLREHALGRLSRAGCSVGRPLIAMHFGSGGKRKCWPLERYLELIQRLRKDNNHFFILFSGPAEDEVIKRSIQNLSETCGEDCLHIQEEGLLIVSAFLSLSTLYVGNDSGITHLASAVNIPVLGLFGPTDAALWAPFSNTARVISSIRACAPCGEGIKICKDQQCLSGISADIVYRTVAALLRER